MLIKIVHLRLETTSNCGYFTHVIFMEQLYCYLIPASILSEGFASRNNVIISQFDVLAAIFQN